MKNKNVLKVFGIMLLTTFVLTWIIPSATIGQDGVTIGKIAPTGFADIFSCLDIITQYFAKPAVFILFVGMFYGVINKSGALKSVVNKFTSVSVTTDQLLCFPEPFILAKGFSCKRHCNPCFLAISCINSINK